jgi:hypothetical protein
MPVEKGDDVLKVMMLKIGFLAGPLVLCLVLGSLSMAAECGDCIVATVPGQYTPLPPVEFIEEWDNGLTGNHPWIHNAYIPGPDFGYVTNAIEAIDENGDGVLYKDSVRYVAKENNTLNESVFNFHDTPPFKPGLPITPETYVEFRIDDLTINELPPAPAGYTTGWQYFSMNFNSGPGTEIISVQFSKNGHWAPSDLSIGTNIYYFVSLGEDSSFNIYSIFQESGLEVPEPLFLVQVVFNQTLWYLSEPSTVQHHQHMEVDYIRVLDGRE